MQKFSNIVNAITVDLEDWYHPDLLKNRVNPRDKRPQIMESTAGLLELFERYNVKATFFVLGEVAKECPDLILNISHRGHEIACHGYSHRPLLEMTESEFISELDRFDEVLKGILGRDYKAVGFRAPTFSLNKDTVWAIPVLKEKGFLYDSSVFPLKHRFYGISGTPLGIYFPSRKDLRVSDKDSDFIEFPLTACEFLGIRFPVAGGFYLRVTPISIFIKLLKIINKSRPFNIYIHPWECYSDTPRLKIPKASRFILYNGIDRMLDKVKRIVEEFEFDTIRNIINNRTCHKDTKSRRTENI